MGWSLVKEETLIKIVAIVSLVFLEVVNLMTVKYDGAVIGSIGAIIGGIAGYEVGKRKKTNK